mmetsp:Transcript_4839/g.6273  ORF Transcript_4839/g.6273 Transcript_4839/m.6273 type:complete len:111 (+) Transcript_4839:1068-1400(+)
MANLVNNNVLVGILENLKDSLYLIQGMIDQENKLSEAYKFYSSPLILESIENANMANTRRQTISVVETIQLNQTLKSLLDEYLKHEYRIYNFALHLHKVQVRTIGSAMST